MRDAKDDDVQESLRFRLKTAAALLAFYAALHLGVGALLQALTPGEAMAAIAPVASLARGCKLEVLIESACLFD